jgi:uncharacterized protein
MWPEARWLLVSLHDVAPATWPQCQRVLDAIAEVTDIPLTLLLVPAYHGHCSAQPAFEAEMSRLVARGHELALHGYFHIDAQLPDGWIDWLRRRVYTAGEGEFAALSQREATERLFLGRRWFAANGWPLMGFVPPAWLMGPGAWQALRADGQFEYTSTLGGLHLLRQGRTLRAPVCTYSARSPLRRALSVAFNGALGRALAQTPVVRLALHPHDADHPIIRRSWQRHLERLLRHRRPTTKAALVRVVSDSREPLRAPTGTSTARFPSVT